jgi:S-formylglutathione hydrolase FrmB
MHQNIDNIFGGLDTFYASENYLPNSFDKLKKSGKPIPKIYMCCGKQDFAYEENIRFRDHILSSGTNLVFEEEDGQHTWDFWNRMMPRVLKFLGFSENPNISSASLG